MKHADNPPPICVHAIDFLLPKCIRAVILRPLLDVDFVSGAMIAGRRLAPEDVRSCGFGAFCRTYDLALAV